MTEPFDYERFLASILETFNCQTGTIHRTAVDGVTLELICQIGVPDFLLAKISTIPFGKGIAGAAAERAEPVELCNLQQDLGGVAQSAAQQTGVAGSIAVPIFSPASHAVIGTLGIGKFTPHEFTPAEKQRVQEYAAEIAIYLGDQPC
jgi:L-methionine (R)-S-oxide reductase